MRRFQVGQSFVYKLFQRSIVYRLMPGRNLYNLAGVFLVTKHHEITYMCNQTLIALNIANKYNSIAFLKSMPRLAVFVLCLRVLLQKTLEQRRNRPNLLKRRSMRFCSIKNISGDFQRDYFIGVLCQLANEVEVNCMSQLQTKCANWSKGIGHKAWNDMHDI